VLTSVAIRREMNFPEKCLKQQKSETKISIGIIWIKPDQVMQQAANRCGAYHHTGTTRAPPTARLDNSGIRLRQRLRH
jgi:hypothetical protein